MSLTYERAAEFLRPRLWLAFVAGGLMWGAWLGSLALGDGVADVFGQIVSMDHLAFYTPARMILEGRTADIYDLEELYRYQQSVIPEGHVVGLEAMRNPPFFALLFLPTARLSFCASAWIWNAVGIGCVIVGIRLLRPERPWRVTIWALCFMPVFAAVSYGQNSLLSFLVLCVAYRLLTDDRTLAAGLVAGLLWFKPPLLLGLIVWWVLEIRWAWRCLVGLVITGFVLTVVSYLIIPEAWLGFVNTLGDNARFTNFDWWKAHNARAFWRQILPKPIPLLSGETLNLQIVLWLISDAVGLWVLVRVWRACRDSRPVMFGAAMFFMLWATPHAMIYEWAVAVVPAVAWWVDLPRFRNAWLVLFMAVGTTLFVSTDVGRVQEYVQKKWFDVEYPVVLQLSVPVFAFATWRASRLLIDSRNGPDPSCVAATAADARAETPDGSRGQDGQRIGSAPLPRP
ncbi:glycosyltransferase family 87 protein [Fimbriiglobus ruber]|uniref:DUF2029 domain-containing protein n=1 Tax=Fimbriiglobus ruber TaxID=1908690 RepID=A0A225E499_9BACT|nr:glycosyltransferase family 87 protein [Fimbriiglobus ruber]OWK43237.1 hypothetical protein FRUB_02836 [Fimbriiglobus ruber]